MIKALLFDVFGTVVDWRQSVINQFSQFELKTQIKGDWEKVTDLWRQNYQPSMEDVRSGKRPWVNLDTLHKESLVKIIDEMQIQGVKEDDLDQMTLYWHNLDQWSDVEDGLNKLRSNFTISTLSNGGTKLLTNLSHINNIKWDNIFSAENFKCYKPDPKTYLGASDILGHKPNEVLMVAAHNQDLQAAKSCGLMTAFVSRPKEYGENQDFDLKADENIDISATDFIDLSNKIV
ncbi:MAG: (S)-2-haloacid dehalogenase 4A [Alphaproteobacteria bacterium MarineAlpha9_Bin2]|nr:MAG: (S)-2-haloacid dehalogenase 4A [Alphaproteobacteria bacterium MarineAlpha9_Bin2]